MTTTESPVLLVKHLREIAAAPSNYPAWVIAAALERAAERLERKA